MGVGEARAKLLLWGEHAAVYGHPAVGCSLPWGLRAVHTPGPRWELPGLGPHEKTVRRLLDRLESLAGEESLPPPLPGRLEIATGIPPGSGFGSSGALCAALVNLFWGDRSLTDRDRLAWKAEALFHGSSSGIDTALALRQGWWRLDASSRPAAATPLADPGLVLAVGAVVRDSDTKTLVANLARRAGDDPEIRKIIDGLGALAARAADAVAAGRREELPILVNRARDGLRTLGLETPPLTAVLEAGLRCPGCQAGKLSGAGGGGAFFLVFQDAASAREALRTVEAAAGAAMWVSRPRVF